jgi:hypothetical protein
MRTKSIIAILAILVLTACGTTKPHYIIENKQAANGEAVEPVKNICFVIRDLRPNGKYYSKLEAYLREELKQHGVDIHFFGFSPLDSLADEKFRDTVNKYQFDFIIREAATASGGGRTTVMAQGWSLYDNQQSPLFSGPIFSTLNDVVDMSFVGYRKKGKYQLAWKSTCESIQVGMFEQLYKKAAACLINSLIANGLVIAKK